MISNLLMSQAVLYPVFCMCSCVLLAAEVNPGQRGRPWELELECANRQTAKFCVVPSVAKSANSLPDECFPAKAGPLAIERRSNVRSDALFDLNSLTGSDFSGVVGADLCRNYVAEVKSGNPNIRLLNEVPNSAMSWTKSTLQIADNGVSLDLCGQWFLVAPTGLFSLRWPLLKQAPADFLRLKQKGEFVFSGNLARSSAEAFSIYDEAVVLDSKITNCVIINDETPSVGLSFLARYDWYFDFKNLTAFSSPVIQGEDCSFNRGLYFDYGKGARGVFLFEMHGQGQGKSVGLQQGDELLGINGMFVKDISLFEINRQIQFSNSDSLSLTIRRSGKPFLVPWKRGN